MPENSKTNPNKTAPEPSFEKTLAELEEIVSQLESGSRPLEESLALYERGVAALKRCHAILDKAEKRIKTLVRGPEGQPQLREDQSFTRELTSSSGRNTAPEEDTAEAAGLDQEADAEPAAGQNPKSADTPKTCTNQGKSNAGGTLFGRGK